ncbi:hypothetical protein KA107_03030 [Candidatus Pacearchaeota archaeon]|nr:hypothetical protein [Candidatus Pacearchaeota archaeon]
MNELFIGEMGYRLPIERTLYGQLTFAERLNNRTAMSLTRTRAELDKELKTYDLDFLPEDFPQHYEHPHINEKAYQKKILDNWVKRHAFLGSAIEQGKTLASMLESESQINRGIKSFLPRKKDSSRNEYVEQMEELIGGLPQLKHEGIFAMRDLTTTFLSSAGGAAILFGGVVNWANKMAGGLSENATLTIPLIGGAVIGALTTISMGTRPSNTCLPFDKAKYIDEKVKEFYH